MYHPQVPEALHAHRQRRVLPRVLHGAAAQPLGVPRQYCAHATLRELHGQAAQGAVSAGYLQVSLFCSYVYGVWCDVVML